MPSTSQISQMQACVSASSRSQVISILGNSIKSQLSSSRWIRNRNRYISLDCVSRISGDSGGTLNSRDASEYISVSAILHCKDGWEYFSSSIQALLNGNYRAAIHMAYYAELRAAMAFLASDGIGVFNNKHVYVNPTGVAQRILSSNYGTHKFVWFALKEWANHSSKSSFIFDTIEIGGHSISAWIREAGIVTGSPTISLLASDWLKKWSLDLQILSEDHNIRNEVSYRPKGIKYSRNYNSDFEKELKFILKQWGLCEPSSSGNFQVLDLLLLRNTLIHLYKVQRGSVPTQGQLSTYVNGIMTRLGIASNSYVFGYLTKENHPLKSPILKAADLKTTDSQDRIRPLSVIARAFLLLRISSASNKELLSEGGITKNDLRFWWNVIGIESGFWKNGNEPNRITDLWIDISDSVDSAEDWLEHTNDPEKVDFFLAKNLESIYLTQYQRAFLWSVGI